MKIDIQKHWGDKEIYYPAELCAKIIDSMIKDGEAYLWTTEGKSGYNNGFFTILDELSSYYNWDKTKITLCTSNQYDTHPTYRLEYIGTSMATEAMKFNVVLPWNKEKLYGMFIGRASSSRIRALHKHWNLKYQEQGLTSFTEDLFEYMSKPDLVDYFLHSGQTYKEMVSIPTPYSDIKDIVATEFNVKLDPIYTAGYEWNQVYEKIAIDIVCETSTEPNVLAVSEKTFRPLYYKRPFLLIGSPGQLGYLRNNGFKTFNDFFSEDYDALGGIARVDRVFEILENILDQGVESLLTQAEEILSHNQKVLREYCSSKQKG
jgi:hypothetical protein